MLEHTQQYPPVGLLVPELLAYQSILFIQANTQKEDRHTILSMGDLIPWHSVTESTGQKIQAVEEQIKVLPPGDPELPALRLQLARLVTKKE